MMPHRPMREVEMVAKKKAKKKAARKKTAKKKAKKKTAKRKISRGWPMPSVAEGKKPRKKIPPR